MLLLRRRILHLLLTMALLLTTLLTGTVNAASDEPAENAKRFNHGDLLMLRWADESEEIKGHFWIQPTENGADPKPMPISMAIKKTNQAEDGSLGAQDITFEGPKEIAPGLIANYTYTIKRKLPAGAYRIPLIVQAPGGYKSALDLKVLVLAMDPPKKGDGWWEIPLTLPAELTKIEVGAVDKIKPVQVLGVENLNKPEGKAELKLRLTGTDGTLPAQGSYEIPLDVTVAGLSTPHQIRAKVALGATVVPPKEGYKVQYVKPFPFWLLYYVRNLFNLPTIEPGATVVQGSLYDNERHRTFPANQLVLLSQGGDLAGPAFVKLSEQGQKRVVSLAVRPSSPRIRPGSYSGEISINGQPVTVTVDVRHSVTPLFLIALLAYLLPAFLGWLKAQQAPAQKEAWTTLWGAKEVFILRGAQPRLLDHLFTWIIADLIHLKPLEGINRQLHVVKSLGAKEWETWLAELEQMAPSQKGVWRKLRRTLSELPNAAPSSQIHAKVIAWLKDAKVKSSKIDLLVPPMDVERTLEGAENEGLPKPSWSLRATIQRFVSRVRGFFTDGLPSLLQYYVARSLANSDKVWQLTLSAGALIAVLWQTYKGFKVTSTFGADLLMEYGTVISTALGAQVVKQLLTTLLGKKTEKE